MRLRYTGPHPTVFAYCGVALVNPGDVFWVADSDAPGFLARADIEEAPEAATPERAADEAPAPRVKARKTPAPAPAGDEPTDATEPNP